MKVRIAMWSGPRNISTALMRSFGNRPDTVVCDEPLYAHYLLKTGRNHPGADEVIASQENDWRKVAKWLTGPIPDGKTVFYQKHMAHHLLPEIERGWLEHLTNCFLIRDPKAMLLSLTKVFPEAGLMDTGLPQQVEVFEWIRERTGRIPPVIDSRDVLENPQGVLSRLCEVIGIEFGEAMLFWEPGPRSTDGVWAKHWYAEVEKASGFRPYREKDEALPGRLGTLYAECQKLYEQLQAYRLLPATRE